MKRAIALSISFLIATSAAQASNVTHQGTAKTANTLTQWSTGSFPVKGGTQMLIGKTATLNCASTAGCVIHMVLDVDVQAKKTGGFAPVMAVDHLIASPVKPFTVTCHADESCAGRAPTTAAVARGKHTIAYGVASSFDGTIVAWSGHAEMNPQTK